MIKSYKTHLLVGVSALMALSAHPAVAQTVSPTPVVDEDERPGDDIVVTGSQIRGVSPTGAPVIQFSREQITATGATSANDVLSHIPQVTSAFLANPTTPAGDAGLSVVRPNLRALPNSASNTTLVLVDGHRLAGAGLIQTTADPDIIPPGVLESVEIVTGGGSSIYGSDAIGGVINFITRKRFDGVEISGRYGMADRYWTRDVNITAGKDWGSGSAYVSFVNAKNNALFGRDRDYVQQVSAPSLYCLPGTIYANGTTYALPNRTPGTVAPPCDNSDDRSFWPAVERTTVFGSLNQSITDGVTLDVRGYWSKRNLVQYQDRTDGATDLTIYQSSNPYFSSIAGETSQIVRTNFGDLFPASFFNKTDAYGLTPTLTIDLPAGWQARAMYNYGKTRTHVGGIQLNAASIASALGTATGPMLAPANAINPYNLGASGAAALASITRVNSDIVDQDLNNARLIVDGSLFRLPGGDLKVAFGGEWTRETYRRKQANSAAGATPVYGNFRNYRRSVNALFGEVNIPIVGAENRMGWIHSLTVTGAVRWDDYSDVGSTTNPRVGLNYEPVDWIRIRGDWGKSFNAPSLVDKTGIFRSGFVPRILGFSPGQTAPWTFFVAGNSADNRPQTATTWSVGADIEPPVLPGLKLSATYYNLHLKNMLGLLFGAPFTPENRPYVQDGLSSCSQLADQSLLSPTQDDFGAIQGLPAIPAACAAIAASQGTGSPITFAVLDYRTLNLGVRKQDGIDFSASYNTATGFGSINASVAGTYTLSIKQAAVAGAAFIDQLASPGNSRLFLSSSLGAQVGPLTATATVNHRQGYDIFPIRTGPRFPDQSHVDSFTTLDLYASLALPAYVLSETVLTVNIQNVFDTDPPFFNGANSLATSGYTNGSTLGRLIQVGIRKKF